jgi:hypothetical protein
MKKVKIFRFRINSISSVIFEGDEKELWYNNGLIELESIEKVEETINVFLTHKELVSMNVSTIDVRTHRNGRGNTVDLIYTIVYK